MAAPVFFGKPEPLRVSEIIAITGCSVKLGADTDVSVTSIGPLESARPGQLTFLENVSYADRAGDTSATACFVAPKFASKIPDRTIALIVNEPYKAYAKVAARLYSTAMKPGSAFETVGVSPGSFIHPTARLEEDVVVDPGAVIGPRAEVGARSFIGAHAVIGPDVRIGRGSSIGAGATVQHALLGNRVIVHSGARIGQDGFGFAMGPGGHVKVAQIGRVVIQDDVEIGANTAIDRGATRDTTIGEGTKIDNLVQIGHNCTIGRHCVIVAQVGLAGSSRLEDYVVVAGQVGVAGHVTIGMGAQIGAQSGVMADIPPGSRQLGSPSRPAKQAMREHLLLAKLAQRAKD